MRQEPSVSSKCSILVNSLRPGFFADSTSINSRLMEKPRVRAYSARSLRWAGMEYPSRSCSRLETRAYENAAIMCHLSCGDPWYRGPFAVQEVFPLSNHQLAS